MTEVIEESAQVRENLTLEPQFPMIIPKEIKDLRLSGQLPTGDVGYFDVKEPDTLRLVDQETWKPVTKKGIEQRVSIAANAGRRFAGLIIHTPPRTPEQTYRDYVEKVANLLKRSAKRNEGIITEQSLGTLFVVEQRANDERVGWREEEFRDLGLVVDKQKGEKSVVITSDYIISQGRRPKQRSAVDLTRGGISGNMFTDFPDAIERNAAEQGIVADTSSLRKESRATKFVPRTLTNLREGNNVTYYGSDDAGKSLSLEKTQSGEEIATPNAEGFADLRVTPRKQEATNQKGDEFRVGQNIPTNEVCTHCSRPLLANQYQEKGEKVFFNKKDVFCPSDGFVRKEYLGYQGGRAPFIKDTPPEDK